MNESQINAIVDAVVRKLSPDLGRLPAAPAPAASRAPAFHRSSQGNGLFDDLESATAAAQSAQAQWADTSLETRDQVIAAMRHAARLNTEALAAEAVQETKLGNVKDKIQKLLLVANKTPGIEILRPRAYSGDHGLMLTERAPFGIIGAIAPSTNPTETILNNGIGMVAGGNAAVFNAHPSAKKVSAKLVQLLNEAMVSAGGPANLISCIAEPTIESAQALMKHKAIRLIVVTGGPAVVKAAMNSGKRAIAAGPGNPPAVVDETADLAQAGKDIVDGASFDNNIVCIVEKEVFAVAGIADVLKKEMCKHGAYELKSHEINKVEKLVVVDGHAARDFVGKDAAKIAEAAGISVPSGTRLLLAEVDPTHPFIQTELLMPVLGFSRLKTVEDCIAAAVQAEHGFGHTATMHSANIHHLSSMARVMNTSIFVKNAPSYAGLGFGGEGYTSFTIASPTGEGLTTALSFTRERRCTPQRFLSDRLMQVLGPALGLLEIDSIAKGMGLLDVLVKKAAVRLLRAEAVSPGKYLILYTGSVGEVDEAHRAGAEAAGSHLLDQLFLAHASETLLARLIQPTPMSALTDSLGIVETRTATAAVAAADHCLKRARVELAFLHLAQGIGGKAYYVVTGALDQVQSALETSAQAISAELLAMTQLIERPHPDMLAALKP